jgi:integrase
MQPLLPTIALLLPPRPQDAGTQTPLFGRNKTGFSGWSKAKERLDKRMAQLGASEHWTLHDMRRTFSRRLNDAGVPTHIVEALHAHEVPGVAGVYNHAAYRQAKAEALQVWLGLLAKVMA